MNQSNYCRFNMLVLEITLILYAGTETTSPLPPDNGSVEQQILIITVLPDKIT